MLPEFGAVELLLIAAIALIVVGPKDLPVLMRKVGKFLAHMRGMAAEFRASFDEMARQSELDELRREVEAMRQAAHAPLDAAVNHLGVDDVKADIEAGLAATAPRAPAPAASAEAVQAPDSPTVEPSAEHRP